MKINMMKKAICLLMICAMVLGLHVPVLGEENTQTSVDPTWNYTVTYVESDSSFTVGAKDNAFMHSFTIEEPKGNAANFLGWGSLPDGEVQYRADGKTTGYSYNIALLSSNRHAILYAIYGNQDDNIFSIYYVTNGNGRTEMFRSTEKTYTATISGAYAGGAEGFLGWATTEGAKSATYVPGDEVTLTFPAEDSDQEQSTNKASQPLLTLYAVMDAKATATYDFVVHYYSGGKTKTVTYPSASSVAYITLETMEGVTGWSMTPGGDANFAPGTEICLQYNQPELMLYAAGEEVNLEPAQLPPAEDEEDPNDEPEEAGNETVEAVWTSSDENVATVDQTGLVTAVNAGLATITITYNGHITSMKLTVIGTCAQCGAENAAHQLMPCGDHCEAQMTDKTHSLASCEFEGGTFNGVTFEAHYDCDGQYHSSYVINQHCILPGGHQHTACWPDKWHSCDADHDYNPNKDGIQEGCGNKYTCWGSDAHRLCQLCGDMWCDYDNGGHETACGIPSHRPCQINENGYYQIADHQICPHGCGGHLCNGKSHGTEKGQCSYVEINCTYCAAEGIQHNAENCGIHCTAQAGNHTKCICGGWACVGTHGEMPCGHHCKQSESGHEACPYGCGGYLCDGESHGTAEGQCDYVPPIICSYCGTEGEQHDAAACGDHCVKQSGEHRRCETNSAGCGGWLCSGDHSLLTCEHCSQVSRKHEQCSLCNRWICYTPDISHGTGAGQCSYEEIKCRFCAIEGVQHEAEDCNIHCTAQEGDHTECICGGWACVGTHGEMPCGHYCKQSESGHEACPYGCGGYLCDGLSHSEELCSDVPDGPCWGCDDPNSFHRPLECDSHCAAQAQDGNHTRCAYCESFLCDDAPHGDGVCNTDIL